MSVVKRPYRSLVDFPAVRRFLLPLYERDWRNGAPAPYFEYAQALYWTDQSQTHRIALWEDEGRLVALCFYETQIGEAYFNLDPAYARLAPELLAHAESRLRADDGGLELVLFGAQTAMLDAARAAGYEERSRWTEGVLDLTGGLPQYALPEGYAFVPPGQIDMRRMIDASWRGFNHDLPAEGGVERGYHLQAAPNATPELDVVVQTDAGEYAAYAGMWWTPENRLAYLEPLCTVPEHRRRGLASAVISEMARRVRPLGATHMTGGDNPFYFAIGYKPGFVRTVWRKPEPERSDT